jgi:type I restriction enzyme S subunit
MGNVPNLRFPEFSGEWSSQPLTDFMNFKNGLNPDAKRFGRGTKFISVMDILNNQYICYDNIRASVELQDGDIETYGVDYGDILFQRSSETLEDVGRANVYLDSKPAIFGGFVIRGKSKGNYNPLFFRYLLASPTARKRIIVKGAGAQHFNIGQDGLSKVSLDIPRLSEQEKIGKLLQCVDARIATQTKIIEDLKKLKSAIAQKLLNDRVLLETRISLGEVCELKNGYAFKSSSYCRDGKYKIITIANVQGNRYISTEDCKTISYLPKDLQKHQVLRENDILISMTGNVGRVSLCNDGHYLLNQRVGLLAPKIKEVEFLFQVLASEHFEQSMIACGQGAAQMNIGKSDIDGYMLPFSRKSDNMNHIAKVLLAYDNCTNTNVKLLDYLILQKQYLLSQMFI